MQRCYTPNTTITRKQCSTKRVQCIFVFRNTLWNRNCFMNCYLFYFVSVCLLFGGYFLCYVCVCVTPCVCACVRVCVVSCVCGGGGGRSIEGWGGSGSVSRVLLGKKDRAERVQTEYLCLFNIPDVLMKEAFCFSVQDIFITSFCIGNCKSQRYTMLYVCQSHKKQVVYAMKLKSTS